ncbi:hypothetical protein AAZX31_09G122200 [Glycine max]
MFFSPFPHGYYFTISNPGVFCLPRWSLLIHTRFHMPMLLGSECKLVMLSATGLSPFRVQHSLLLRLAARHLYSSLTTPFSRFRLLPFCSPLLWESLLLSFPLATKMF